MGSEHPISINHLTKDDQDRYGCGTTQSDGQEHMTLTLDRLSGQMNDPKDAIRWIPRECLLITLPIGRNHLDKSYRIARGWNKHRPGRDSAVLPCAGFPDLQGDLLVAR